MPNSSHWSISRSRIRRHLHAVNGQAAPAVSLCRAHAGIFVHARPLPVLRALHQPRHHLVEVNILHLPVIFLDGAQSTIRPASFAACKSRSKAFLDDPHKNCRPLQGGSALRPLTPAEAGTRAAPQLCECNHQGSGVPPPVQRNARPMPTPSESREECGRVQREKDASLGRQCPN